MINVGADSRTSITGISFETGHYTSLPSQSEVSIKIRNAVPFLGMNEHSYNFVTTGIKSKVCSPLSNWKCQFVYVCNKNADRVIALPKM
jgi:hypothetical protein